MRIILSIFIMSMVTGVYAQTHVFKPLPYAYDALEPYIDSQTMEVHYSKHHQNYYNKFIEATRENTKLEQMTMIEIFANMSQYSDFVRNNGGGYWNHEFFWETMTPGGKALPDGELKNLINAQFGSLELFQSEFKKSAVTLFGSGWTWLIIQQGKLKIVNTANQDNPYMNTVTEQGIPLLGIDLWEHAYYLKFQNKRGDYIDQFFKVIDWPTIQHRYQSVIKK